MYGGFVGTRYRDGDENEKRRNGEIDGYLSWILAPDLPRPPPCSRRSICRSGRRSRADSRTCWSSWPARPSVSCSRRVLRSRCLTRISLLPFCASRSSPLPPCVVRYQRVLSSPCYAPPPSLSSGRFYARPAAPDNPASSRPRGRPDTSSSLSLKTAESHAFNLSLSLSHTPPPSLPPSRLPPSHSLSLARVQRWLAVRLSAE